LITLGRKQIGDRPKYRTLFSDFFDEKQPNDMTASVVFLITGASRGLGRAIATVAGNHYARGNGTSSAPPTSRARFLLVARSSEGLQETKEELLSASKASSSGTTTTTSEDDVLCRSMDLSNLDRLDVNMDVLLHDLDQLSGSQPQPQQHLVFVNNAASLGHLGLSRKSPSLEDMRRTIDLNATSSLWLSVRFARYVHELEHRPEQSNPAAATLVNVSSLSAVSDAFPGMGIYSAGKAAREMYHALLAKEGDGGLLKTLNYAPGPLATSMTEDYILQSEELEETGLRSLFQSTELLDPSDSARKLIGLLEANDFASGSHIDYFDLPDN
jgi:sepiapterin reductase